MAVHFRRALARGHVRDQMLFGARTLGLRGVFVTTESTPNPESVMFRPGECDVLVGGGGVTTMAFKSKHETLDSPLASALFKVHGVSEVMLASHHVTVTKKSGSTWDVLQPNVELVMSQFFAAGLQPLREGVAQKVDVSATSQFEEGSVEANIVELLEERVRPHVQQDGGDIEFHSFDSETGKVYVRMQGACSGCPSANITLQSGIQNLMSHFIPEVTEIVDIEAATVAASEQSFEELEEDNEPGPGKYRITYDGAIVNETSSKDAAVIAKLPMDTVVKVLEVAVLPDDDRIRGRIEDPSGWVSLWNPSQTMRWAVQEFAGSCPAGHGLKAWVSNAIGDCDGCGKEVPVGTEVMDCRRCNWFLCEDCLPSE